LRAFFHSEQIRHDPQQFMRMGRIAPAQDVPQRAEILLRTVRNRSIPLETPPDYGLQPVSVVHDAGYLDFLSTVFERWQALPSAGPEVLPNVFPYWNGRPDWAARPPCPATSVVAQVGYYVGDLAAPIGPQTWSSALASAHSAAAAADAVLAGDVLAYGLTRPSGHHARRDRSSGFCYLNNAAVAAERLRSRFARVAILDIDAHHGDGTQQIFYDRPDVLTASIHGDPATYYPFFTGYASERGVGAGEGFNLNLPLAPGTDDAGYLDALDEALGAIEGFRPDAVIVALGYDIHRDDPIGVFAVTTDAFEAIGARIAAVSRPVVVIQEGGYGLAAIGACLDRFLTGIGAGTRRS
jgi:acetoin utilization deacetylase AcuC-like enzyme